MHDVQLLSNSSWMNNVVIYISIETRNFEESLQIQLSVAFWILFWYIQGVQKMACMFHLY